MQSTCDIDVAFEVVGEAGFADPTRRDRLGMLLWLLLEARWPACMWTVLGSVCHVTLPIALAERAGLATAVGEVVALAPATMGVELRAAVGSTGERSRYEAARALAALRRRNDRTRVVDVERGDPVAVLAVVGALVDAWGHLRSPKLDTLRSHDAAHQTTYVDSLRAYLESFGDIAATARRLGVPAQTARYRLRRAVEIAALDLADTDERLACSVELACG